MAKLVGAVLATTALEGCVSGIYEQRVEGAAHPTERSTVELALERRAGPATEECREVTTTLAMAREVEVRRSLASPVAQAKNIGAAIVLGGAIAFLSYAEDQAGCPPNGGGCGAVIPSQVALLGVAAIPLGFLVYNALRAQGRTTIEQAAPEVRDAPWHPCDREADAPRASVAD